MTRRGYVRPIGDRGRRRLDREAAEMAAAAEKWEPIFEAAERESARLRAEQEAERAKTLPLAPAVTTLRPGECRGVPSSSEPGKTYVVANVGGVIRCECLGWQRWRPSRMRPERSCRHSRLFAAEGG